MKEEGAIFEDTIELRESSAKMRGMYAKKDLAKNEMILFVPDHLINFIE
jgi:hypothetical protein